MATFKDMGNLEGKVAVVTGGGGGIGRAVCETLAYHGAIVVPADIKPELCQPLVDSLGADKCWPVKLDVMSEEGVKESFKAVNDHFGHIDILVNIAGILSGDTLDEVTTEHWDKMIDINQRGVFYCTKYAIPYLAKSEGAAVCSVASQAGQIGGWMGSLAYSASKGAILAMTKAFSRQVTPSTGIRFNDVAPGLIATPLTEGRGDNAEDKPGIPRIQINRLGTGYDIANAIYFLVSDLSSYITGTTIDINGGMFMRS